MIKSFILPVKKHLGMTRKVLATVLVLTLSILQSTNAAAVNEIIMDNGEAGTSSTGRWRSSKRNDPYGKNHLYTFRSGATYTYSLDLPTAGEYKVFAWWNGSRKHLTSVPYDITHLGGTSTVTVNQKENNGKWNQLGTTWHLDKTATITIRSLGNGSTSADAIMLVPTEVSTAPESEAPVENTAPLISGTPAGLVTANEGYSFQPGASDPDGDKLTFSISNKPAWASFSTSTGYLSGTPNNDDVGTTNNILITVNDGAASASIGPFSITVNNTNDAPVISGTPGSSVNEDSAYNFQPTASDSDGDKLTFSISNKPAWASFSTSNGYLSGTPKNGDVGVTNNILITVNDGAASASIGPFSITVNNTNDVPVISGVPATSVAEGSAYNFQPTASDPDGDQLTFRISNKPAWASFSQSTGRLRGTPTDSDVNTYSGIVISVWDGIETVNVSLPAFSIKVEPAPAPALGSFSVSWTAPVTRADGEPLSLADISGYRIHFGDTSGTYTDFAEVTNGAATSVIVTDVPVGTSYIVMTTLDIDGRESGYSQEIAKNIP